MKTQDFRGFIEQFGDLTEVQRSALAAAFAGKGSGSEAIALIEMQFSAAPACGHCKSESFGSWGHASGLRRYMCCDAWLDYARALVDRVSLRKAAKRAGIGLEASFRWRHRSLKAARDKRPSVVTGIVEADETLILKSWKGSKRLVARAPGKRGGQPKKLGTSPSDYDIALIMRDRHKVTTDHILPNFEGATFDTVKDPVVTCDSVLVTDGRPSYATFAKDRGMLHVAILVNQGEHVYNGFHIQNVNAYTSRLKSWMAPFKGVASKYLGSYLGWRRMIERDGDRLTPRHAMAQALAG